MAEGLFRKLANGRDDITVESAGVSAANGQPASADAVYALGRKGIDLKSFRSQPVTEELVEEATHIFVMTRDHRRLLEVFYPEASEKIYLLREFEEGSPDVPDPIGQGRQVYERCRDTIERALKSVMDFLEQDDMSTATDSSILEATDPEIFACIQKEAHRQFEHIELIASENFTSRAVMEAQGILPHEQVRRRLPRQTLVWRLRVRRHRRVARHRPHEGTSSAPSTRTFRLTVAARPTWRSISASYNLATRS